MKNIRKRGVTLIELVIAVILVAILAAIAVPVMQSFTPKAILAEGLTGMAAIRSAMNQYYARHDVYPNMTALYSIVTPAYFPDLYHVLKPDSLTNVYFSEGCYFVFNNGVRGVYIICSLTPDTQFAGGSNTAIYAAEARALKDGSATIACLYMSVPTGKCAQWNVSRSGYPAESSLSKPY